MSEDRSVEQPTLSSVEMELERFIVLGRENHDDTIVERLELLAKLYRDLLYATRRLKQEELERVKFLFMRLEILERCIATTRQLELYREMVSARQESESARRP